MKKSLLTIAVITSVGMVSCVKSALQSPAIETTPKIATSDLVVPKGFTWENSRTINFTVNVTDTRFIGQAQIITIYDADPKTGGNVITRGSATTTKAFESKLYISNQITQVYIKKTAADNSQVTQTIQLSSNNIITSIGM